MLRSYFKLVLSLVTVSLTFQVVPLPSADAAQMSLFTGSFAGPTPFEMKNFDAVTGTFVQSFGGFTDTSGYQDIEIGPDNNLYASQYLSDRIARFDPLSGGDLPAPSKSGAIFADNVALVNPTGIAFGANGNLYVANTGTVDEFQGPDGLNPGLLVGTFLSGLGTIDDIEFVQGDFYITKRDGSVLRYDDTGAANPAPSKSGAIFADGMGTIVSRLAEGPDGNLYVSNFSDNNIRRFDVTTGLNVDGGGGSFVSGMNGGLAFGPHDDNLYVTNFGSDRIEKYQGPFGGSPGSLLNATFATGNGLDAPTFLTFYVETVVPEPSSALLLGLGMIGFASLRKRKNRRA